MLAAESLEILARDKKYFGVFQCGCGSGIISPIKHRKFGKRTPRSFYGKNLFTTSWRKFENANLSRRHQEQPGARVAFAKQQLAPLKALLVHSRGQSLLLLFR